MPCPLSNMYRETRISVGFCSCSFILIHEYYLLKCYNLADETLKRDEENDIDIVFLLWVKKIFYTVFFSFKNVNKRLILFYRKRSSSVPAVGQ